MRVLVCGDRYWKNKSFLWATLDGIHQGTPIIVVIGGKAPGADTLGELWTRTKADVIFIGFPAQWTTYGRAAGPIRNQQMLDEGEPDVTVAFHNNIAESKGTKDMLRKSKRCGVPVRLFTEQGEQHDLPL